MKKNILVIAALAAGAWWLLRKRNNTVDERDPNWRPEGLIWEEKHGIDVPYQTEKEVDKDPEIGIDFNNRKRY